MRGPTGSHFPLLCSFWLTQRTFHLRQVDTFIISPLNRKGKRFHHPRQATIPGRFGSYPTRNGRRKSHIDLYFRPG
jgi:hypothetical protein